MLVLPSLLLALSVLPAWRAHSKPLSTTSPQSCHHIDSLVRDASLPGLARSLLLHVGRRRCPSMRSGGGSEGDGDDDRDGDSDGDVSRISALHLQRLLESYPWSPSTTEKAASKQLEAFFNTVLELDPGANAKAKAMLGRAVMDSEPVAFRGEVAVGPRAGASRARRAAFRAQTRAPTLFPATAPRARRFL